MQKKSKKNIITIIIATACQFVILFGISLFNQNLLMTFPIHVRMIFMFLCQWVLLPVPVLLMLKEKEKLRDIGFEREKLFFQIIIGLSIATVMCLVLTVIPILCGFKDMVSSTRYSQPWQFVFQFFYTIFGVALVEEFFFRGYLFKKLLDIRDSKLFAITISSVIFGLFHVLAGGLIQVLITGIIGAIYCFCKEKIKNCTLLSLIIAHGVYDALIVLCVSLM